MYSLIIVEVQHNTVKKIIMVDWWNGILEP